MSLVVSDQSQLVSFSCFCLFSKAIGVSELHSFCIDFGISICCACHFWAILPYFAYFYFFSLQFSAVTSLHMTSLHHNMRGQQGLISPLLLSGAVVRGRTLKTNTGGICGWGCLRWMGHSGLATGDMYILGPLCWGSRVICQDTVQIGTCISWTSKV